MADIEIISPTSARIKVAQKTCRIGETIQDFIISGFGKIFDDGTTCYAYLSKKPSLKFKDSMFVFVSDINFKDIPKKAGFNWDTKNKFWYTRDPDIASKLIDYADHDTSQEIQFAKQKNIESIEKSFQSDTDISIPVPDGLSYLGYQKAGIQYASEKQNCLIADEMGLGKTIQAIGLINLKHFKKIIVVCPAFLKLNWRNELKKWLVDELSISVVNGSFDDADITIINYDILKKYRDQIAKNNYDLAIYDESHYIKNFKANRTKAALAINATKKLYLTGTPILNRPIELFTVLNSCKIDLASNWYRFVKQYCNAKKTKYGWDTGGASNMEEFGRKLRAQIMVRRLKKDVLSELPDKTRQIIELDAKLGGIELKNEISALENYERNTAELKKQLREMRKNKLENSENYKVAIEKMKGFRADFLRIAELRHKTALKKLDSAIEQIENNLENNAQIIVFAHHTDLIKKIEERLIDKKITVGSVTGATDIETRQKIVDAFQAGNIKVFLGSIMACGVGITLTNASLVMFLELEWSPSAISQAEDRAHRIGQVHNILVQFLVFDGSVDSMLAKNIVEKTDVIESILDSNFDITE
jgi:SWI/SNF-related matrix-associated actin-dependent regulator 1 of chromatin subfamily A